MKRLPVTGSNQLLNLLDPFIPDDFINAHWNARPVRGSRWQFRAAQLWRVHLLTLLMPVHSLNLLTQLLAEQRAWRDFARWRHRHRTPDVRILNAFRDRVGVRGLRQINEAMLQPLIQTVALWSNATALIDATDLPAACSGFKKKDTGTYTARHAALGGRTLQTGQSRWFVGYKKHSSRLWWREYAPAVLLVPLVSWVAPANVSEVGLLVPSLRHCGQRWSWLPRQVVADMGYLAAESKRLCRECSLGRSSLGLRWLRHFSAELIPLHGSSRQHLTMCSQ